jgi:phage terminase small subunit
MAEEKELSAKQQKFVDAYLGDARGNASEAARLAGYSAKTAGQQGSRLLKNVEIQAAISDRVSELAMTAEEVLAHLTEIARGDIGQFLEAQVYGKPVIVLEKHDPKTGELVRGNTRLIKKYGMKEGKQEEVVLEMHDRVGALEKLGKYHGLFVDRQEISGPDGSTLTIRVEYEDVDNNA